MKEVDEAVQRHVVAILRIIAGIVALLGDKPRIARRLRCAILRTLRPVESAARRIVIYAAARIRVSVRECKHGAGARPSGRFLAASHCATSHHFGTASPGSAESASTQTGEDLLAAGTLTIRHSSFAIHRRLRRRHPATREQGGTGRVLPLLDPLRRVRYALRRMAVPQHAVPRICVPGVTPWQCLPSPLSGNDLFDSAPLWRRIEAVRGALTDLPSQARRFARWRASQDLELARRKAEAAAHPVPPLPTRAELQRNRARPAPPEPIRYRRCQPLRIGRPPGCRLRRHDPGGRRPSNTREIDEILAHVNALAWEAWETMPVRKVNGDR